MILKVKNLIVRALLAAIVASSGVLATPVRSLQKLKVLEAVLEDISAPENQVNANAVQQFSFNQTLDHIGGDSGYFQQKYFVNDAYYKPGGAIMFYVQGEAAANPRTLSSLRLNMHNLAVNYSALIVSLEHRYYSLDSMPVPDLSIPNLKWLSSRQAILDGVNFITWFKKDRALPECTKVMAVGGSYAGNLAAWYRVYHPDVFFAAQASSAPVLAKENFSEYSRAVRLGLANPITGGHPTCSLNWARAVYLVDEALKNNLNATAFEFGLEGVNNIGDVASAITGELASGIQYGPAYSPFDASVSIVGSVCNGSPDYFPEFSNPNATDAALYSSIRNWFLRYLDVNGLVPNDPSTASQYNTDFYAGHYDLNDPLALNSLWTWQYCTEFGYFQAAEAIHKPVYSQFIDADYYRWSCGVILGNEHSIPDTDGTNAYWGGVDISATRLIWANGEVDPWHWLSNYHRRSTDLEPTFKHDEFHCFDLYSARTDDTPTMTSIKSGINNAWQKIFAQDDCPSIVAASGSQA